MFKSPMKKLIFMDMTIQVEGEKIVTTIYAKPLALYQYIPPNSCHPPGILTGLIFGKFLAKSYGSTNYAPIARTSTENSPYSTHAF
jgi:hypothetical protein